MQALVECTQLSEDLSGVHTIGPKRRRTHRPDDGSQPVGACSGRQVFQARRRTICLLHALTGHSLLYRMAYHLNKRLNSVRFHYTLLVVCDEFSFVYGNNRGVKVHFG